MGFFNNLFGSKTEEDAKPKLPWKLLSDINQLDDIEKASSEKTQILFKHSTRCIISRTVLSMFESSYEIDEQSADLYYLDLLNHREISNKIAEQFEVFHQSPQVLVIKNEQVIYSESHHDINASEINQLL